MLLLLLLTLPILWIMKWSEFRLMKFYTNYSTERSEMLNLKKTSRRNTNKLSITWWPSLKSINKILAKRPKILHSNGREKAPKINKEKNCCKESKRKESEEKRKNENRLNSDVRSGSATTWPSKTAMSRTTRKANNPNNITIDTPFILHKLIHWN